MSIELIREVNELFAPLYPYLARQVAKTYGREEGEVLEIGPYCPGISIELVRLLPKLRVVLGDDSPETNDYFREKITAANLEGQIQVRVIDKYALPLEDESVDLVLFRGGLFFWEDPPKILSEGYRVLRPGGTALIGGGFGADAPNELISSLLDRSRELNRRLNKSRLSRSDVEHFLEQAGLVQQAELDHRHGLWAILRKPTA